MKAKYFTRSTLLLACVALQWSLAGHAVAEQFQPPSLDGFMLHTERDADGDGDGVNETHIRQYLSTNGDSLVSMTTKGVVWAWSMNSNSSSTGNENYVIRDSNCDGVFNEVYGLDEEFHIPDCLK